MNNEDNAQFWEDIYLADDTGWDLNGPTPVFEHIAESLEPRRRCIIGCGRGYDAIMFAKKGFDVTAVDFAASAIENMRKMAEKLDVNLNLVHSDIFDIGKIYHAAFDIVLEYTCFCAINLDRRTDYVNLVNTLVDDS